MNRVAFPPSPPAADERIVADSAAFEPCEAALQSLVLRAGYVVTERQYSVSPDWGQVLRAKVDIAGGAISAPVIVWLKEGEGVGLFVDMGPER